MKPQGSIRGSGGVGGVFVAILLVDVVLCLINSTLCWIGGGLTVYVAFDWWRATRARALPTAKAIKLTLTGSGDAWQFQPSTESPSADTANLAPPFELGPGPRRRNAFERFLHVPCPALAAQGLKQVFATRRPRDVSASEISTILLEYKATGHAARGVFLQLWEGALESFLSDDNLSDAELAYLAELRALFGLAEVDIAGIMERLTHPRFERAIADVLRDEAVSPDERRSLQDLAVGLRIPKRVVARSAEDRRLSADEQKHIDALASDLGVSLEVDGATREKLDRYALLWRIEHGDLPILDAPITLQRSEQCHFTCRAAWHEIRTKTVRVNYSGVSTSIRIMKGARFRVGSISPRRVTRDELTHIDDGTVYITNKRVIFDGGKKNTAIRLSALIGFGYFTDGLVLEKASGRSPHLLLDGDTELAAVVLSAVLENG